MRLTRIPADVYVHSCRQQIRKKRNQYANWGGPRQRVVYFVQAGGDGPIKIGWTDNIDHRLYDLQITSPEKLRLRASLRGGPDLERKIHKYFADHRIRGEWFESEPVLHALSSAGFLGREAA